MLFRWENDMMERSAYFQTNTRGAGVAVDRTAVSVRNQMRSRKQPGIFFRKLQKSDETIKHGFGG